MKSIKSTIARKAVRSTAKHTARGTGSKLKRDPMRSGTLLALGAVVGLLAGRLLARPSAAAAEPAPSPTG